MRAQRVSREPACSRTFPPGTRLRETLNAYEFQLGSRAGVDARAYTGEPSDHGAAARFQVYLPAGQCRPSTISSANALSAGPTRLRWKFSGATGWRGTPMPRRGAWRKASATG